MIINIVLNLLKRLFNATNTPRAANVGSCYFLTKSSPTRRTAAAPHLHKIVKARTPQGSKFTTATTAIAVVAPQTGRGAPRKNPQSTAILAVPFLSLAAVPPEDAKKCPSRTAGRVKNDSYFLSDRPFANCSASGESCDAAVVVENFTTIANLHAHVHVHCTCTGTRTCTCTCARAGTVEVSMAGCVAHGMAVRTTPL